MLGSHTGDYAQNILWLRVAALMPNSTLFFFFFTNDITANLEVEDYYVSSDFCN